MEWEARDSSRLLQGWEVDECKMEVLARCERKTDLRRWDHVDLYPSVIPLGILRARRSSLATINTCTSHSSHIILSKDVFSSPFPFTIVTAAISASSTSLFSFAGHPNTGPGCATARQKTATMINTPSKPTNRPSSCTNGPLYPSLNSSIR